MIPLSKIPPAHAFNSDVAKATVKTSVDRENVNLLLFFRTAANSKMSSFVCTLSTVQNTNKNLFDCQRGFSFKVRAELLSMECKVEIDSTYICRNCQRKRNESALHEVNIALFKRLTTRKRLPLFLTSQCNPNQPSHSQVQSTKRDAMEDLRMYTPRKITAHRQRSVLF